MTGEDQKTLKYTAQNLTAKFKPIVHFCFDDRLNGKLTPGYTKPSMAIADVSRLWVFNCRQPTCFSELGIDEN